MIARRMRCVAAITVTVALLAAANPARVQAADPATTALGVTLGKGSVLWLEGTSNVHDFECRSTEVEITIEGKPGGSPPSDADGLADLIRTSSVGGVVVEVPVHSLRSGKAGLDKNLRRSMRAEEHPRVRFQLARYERKPGSVAGDTIGIRAEGTLTVAGRECPIDLEARAFRSGEGVWLEGSETLLMSDYGIRPPKMMLGTLRVGDRIVVHYRLFLIPRGGPVGSSPTKGK